MNHGRLRYVFSVLLVALVTALAAPPAATPVQAAASGLPIEIHAILPLTGPATFIGKGQLEGLQALEQLVNQQGGVAGRPVKFVVQDDQSSPQVAVQLANALVASQVKIVLGSAIVANCVKHGNGPLPLSNTPPDVTTDVVAPATASQPHT